MRLSTIGYEGIDQNTLFLNLREFNIQKIIDIRELAISRKLGFAKTALIRASNEYRIDY